IGVERFDIETLLVNRLARNGTLSSDADLVSELTTSAEEVKTVRDYLDDLSLALNRAIPNSTMPQAAIDGYKTATNLARTTVAGTLAALNGASIALNESATANAVADKN